MCLFAEISILLRMPTLPAGIVPVSRPDVESKIGKSSAWLLKYPPQVLLAIRRLLLTPNAMVDGRSLTRKDFTAFSDVRSKIWMVPPPLRHGGLSATLTAKVLPSARQA